MISSQMQQDGPEIKSSDLLRLNEQKSIATILNEKEHVVLSTNIFKYNRHGKCEERILVLTNKAILNMLKNSNFIKSIFKKIVNFQDKYQIKRRIDLSSLYGITLTPKRNENVFLIHVINDHDYYYQADNNKMMVLKSISQEYKRCVKKDLPFYFKDSLVILNYCTFKNHLKEKKDLKPKDQPHFLNQSYFQQKDFQDTQYFPQLLCETEQNFKVRPKNFHRIDINQLKPDATYFVLKEEQYRSIHLQSLHKHHRLLKPWFSFFNEKKQLMFIPFMIGGCLKYFISKHIPLSNQILIFYINQLIIILESLEKQGKIYSNLTLDNVYVKSNGYLVLNGLEKIYQLPRKQPDKLLYKVYGNPYYFPPEVIALSGFREEIVVWKLGVIAYYLVTGKFPFQGKNIKELYYSILTKPIEESVIPNFVLRMLQKDRKKRITFAELRNHPELVGVNWSALEDENIQPPFKVFSQQLSGKVPIVYQLKINKEDEVKRAFSM